MAAGVVLLGLLWGAGPASAATTYYFSEPDFEWYASGGMYAGGLYEDATEYHVWTPGDYWALELTDTGISSIVGLDLTLDVIEVADRVDLGEQAWRATLYFDVLVNSVNVGSFSLALDDLNELVTFSFTFDAIAGDDYDIQLLVTGDLLGMELEYSLGSYDISLGRSSVTLAAVPVPTAMLFLGAGLTCIAGFRRKKK